MGQNEALALMKAIRDRLHELKTLRDKIYTTDKWLREPQKIIKPQYDIKFVDKKIVELENFLFKADSKIKQSNAVTQIDIGADVDKLLDISADVDKLLEPLQ